MKNKWTEQDRQAFGDGFRLRAQTIPGRRRYDIVEDDLCHRCGGQGCGGCQQTGYNGGREP